VGTDLEIDGTAETMSLAICPVCRAGVPEDDWAPSCEHQIVDFTSDYKGILGDSRCGNAPLKGLGRLQEVMGQIVDEAWARTPETSEFDPDNLKLIISPHLPEWGMKQIVESADMGEAPGPMAMAEIEEFLLNACPGLFREAAIVGGMTSGLWTFWFSATPKESTECIRAAISRLTLHATAAAAAMAGGLT